MGIMHACLIYKTWIVVFSLLFIDSFMKDQGSGSLTFSERGALKIFKYSAKHKKLVCIAVRGPLERISRTTSGLRSSYWKTLDQCIINIRHVSLCMDLSYIIFELFKEKIFFSLSQLGFIYFSFPLLYVE
jgi:hypothetical protein